MPMSQAKRKEYDKLRPNRRSRRGVKRMEPGKNRTQPFVGVDGEGAGGRYVDGSILSLHDLMHETNPRLKWQQDYKLFRVGDRYILSKNGPLRTVEIFEFLLSRPIAPIYVGYYFDYDVAQILRDVDEDTMRQLLGGSNGFKNVVYWNGYSIHYLPKHKFAIGRTFKTRDGRECVRRDSVRCIYDVGKFFQCAFTKALAQWSIVDASTLQRIQSGKDARGNDVGNETAEITPKDIEYNRLECDALQSLMEAFRDACEEGNCVPSQWIGPGQIAATLLRNHKAPRRDEMYIPHEHCWSAAYYGGRFECSIVGLYSGNVYEYDIRSAYPAAMLKLPCLHCCTFTASESKDATITEHCVAEIEFEHDNTNPYCYFPVRQRDGSLYFPRQARGIYAGPEILAAMRAGKVNINVRNVWSVHGHCDHQPFDWLPELFAFRRSLGPTKGIALKLGLNSMYGKLVQRIGAAPYHNAIWATLITSYVRATLIDAIAQDPNAVIMLATDAVYSTRPLKLQIGEELGQWECKTAESIFIAKPGIYVAHKVTGELKDKEKTRGIGASLFHQHLPEIEKRWLEACRKSVLKPPQYLFDFKLFIGARLALQRNYEHRCSWATQNYTLDFDWSNKRKAKPVRHGKYVVTRPHDGGSRTTSVLYGIDNTAADQAYAEKRLMQEGMPDYFALEPEGFENE